MRSDSFGFDAPTTCEMSGDTQRTRRYGSRMTITVPDELAAAVGLSETSAKLELAISLYQQRKISLGRAAELAGVDRLELQRELRQRGVGMNYGVSDLEADVLVLRETGQL